MRKYVARIGMSIAAVAVVSMASPPTARADTFTLTSGTINLARQDSAYFWFNALPALESRATVFDRYDPPYFCGPGPECTGKTFNLSMSDSLTRTPNSNDNVVSEQFRLGDRWYWFETMSYSIVAGDIIAPADAAARTWFRFSGSATGRSDEGALAAIQFIGRGTASSYWDSRHGWLATSYTLQDPAAVPEPASMFLLGTGLAAIAAVRRRRGH